MRKRRILEALRHLAPPDSPRGTTAEAVGQAAGVLRHNASADLNELCREGLARKSRGRPVYFWATAHLAGDPWLDREGEGKGEAAPAPGSEEPIQGFAALIGADGSLAPAVEQAKAAMLYPPLGLPTLIAGPTGSGKSRLAEAMYTYATAAGRIRPGAPFAVFNCADYAANPQLLMAQLFGHAKGAFTGADRDNPGLIAETEGGMLFLDEIHRLPPDGQEMLFLLMDRGVYRVLGDTSTVRQARITLVGATSEEPSSALLRTFLRRFPVVISLPDLDQRPLEERLALVELFLREEAARVGVPISVSPLALIALLSFRTAGNVGELRSAILMGCARAFLKYMATHSSGPMPLYITHLSPGIQLAYLSAGENVRAAERLVGEDDRVYSPTAGTLQGKRPDKYVPLDLYRELRRRVRGYLESNLQAREIQLLIRTDLDYYLRRLLRMAQREGAPSHRLLDAVKRFVEEAGVQLGRTFGQDVITGLALHLAGGPRTDHFDEQQAVTLVAHCPREYGVVLRLVPRLEEALNAPVTPGEVTFLALSLASHGRDAEPAGVSLLVIAHGDRTATSMADVANRLVGTDRAMAVDMPLDQSLEETLQAAVAHIQESGKTAGALLLVDMGSLTGLGPAISQATGIPVAVVPLVTTAAVIEAARLVGETGMDLAAMESAVRQVYSSDTEPPVPAAGKRVIITTCLTGHGTARKLAAFLEEALPPHLREEVSVQPVDLERGSPLPGLLVEGWRGTVLAAAGTVDPRLPGVQFIGMEQILFGDGLQALVALVEGKQPDPEPEAESLSRDEAVELATRFVVTSIQLENGEEAAATAVSALHAVEAGMGSAVTPSQAARWVIHFSFTLERLCGDGTVYPCSELAQLEQHHGTLLALLRHVLAPVERQWRVTFPTSELGFLALILIA